MTIYMFSVIYLLISKTDTHAFTPTIESLGTAAYFSIVTIATVGYGDIQPASGWARLLACAEILIGVAYTVFFFSVIAGFLRERDRYR
jgi:voltage-gated potassium channel